MTFGQFVKNFIAFLITKNTNTIEDGNIYNFIYYYALQNTPLYKVSLSTTIIQIDFCNRSTNKSFSQIIVIHLIVTNSSLAKRKINFFTASNFRIEQTINFCVFRSPLHHVICTILVQSKMK